MHLDTAHVTHTHTQQFAHAAWGGVVSYIATVLFYTFFWLIAPGHLCLECCFAVGVPLGIIASYNERFRNIQNVVLDAMQTLPYFCYLIPVLMFFGGGIVSAVLATVIYSIPPIIRLTSLGLTQVSGSYSEVSRSFGGTLLQTLGKVKFPLAVPSLVIGFNQTVILAFAMQIVTPLIGGKGLGLEVFNGLARSDTGRGLAAGIAIVLLAIIIDRITLAYTKKQRIALGLIKE